MKNQTMKRSRYIFFLLVFIPFSFLFSQIQQPVKWKFSVNKISDSEAELILKVTIDKNWHIYSMQQESDQGPISLTFNFEKNKNYSLDGKTIEPTPKKMYDKNFEMNVK